MNDLIDKIKNMKIPLNDVTIASFGEKEIRAYNQALRDVIEVIETYEL